MSKAKQPGDFRAMRQELLETRYRLRYVEAGRPLRIITFTRRFLANPIKGVTKLGEVPGLFKRIEVPKPDYTTLSDDYFGPQSIYQNNSLLKYPHLKIACLGTVERFYKVAHAFELGDVNWADLLERGIDMLVVDMNRYEKLEQAQKWLEMFYEKEVPIIAIVHDKKQLQLKPVKEAKLVLSPDNLKGAKSDENFVDITQFNPLGWSRVSTRGARVIGNPDNYSLALETKVDHSYIEQKATIKKDLALVVEAEEFTNVYELNSFILKAVSMGVPLLLNGKSKLASDVGVFSSTSTKDISDELNKLEDEEYRERYSIKLRRKVHLEYSQINYTENLLEKLNIPLVERGKVSIIMSTMRDENLELALENVAKQNYQDKELVVIMHGDKFNTKKAEKLVKQYEFPIKLIHRPTNSIFGENLNLALDNCTGKYVTKMDDDDYYGENHLKDLYAALLYSGAEIVGKWSNWVYLSKADQTISWAVNREESFGHHLPGATIFMETALLKKVRFGRVKRAIDTEMFRRIEMRGGRMYSTHRYNFVRVRHDDHTYKTDEENFLAHSSGKKYKGYDDNNCFI